MHTLVIRLAAVGDVAMVAAVLRDAAIQHPDRHYTLLSKERMRALLSVMPTNVSFLAYGEPIPWGQFDRVIDANMVGRSLRIDLQALLHLKPLRILNKLSQRPMISRYERLLEVTREQRTGNREQGTGIGIAPFAAHRQKIYPLYRMEQVVAALSKGEEEIYLFGHGPQEQIVLQQWAEHYPHVHCTVGQYTMEQELELMSHLRVMLTMDSANMHLASLVGTRVISIWGATHPKSGFLGDGQSLQDCIQMDMPCRPCSSHGQKKCRYGDCRCLHIDPTTIVQAIQQTPRATSKGESIQATTKSSKAATSVN